MENFVTLGPLELHYAFFFSTNYAALWSFLAYFSLLFLFYGKDIVCFTLRAPNRAERRANIGFKCIK